MATVSILQPSEPANMATRRAPLASVPNAVNSPFRNTAHNNAIGGKRTRAQAGDAVLGQPAAKKLIIEIPDDNEENYDPPKKCVAAVAAVAAQDKLDEPFSKRATGTHAQPTAFERKLVSARERKPATQQQQQRVDKTQKADLESVRQWQRHYSRQFPTFVIYFESVPDDVRQKAVHQLRSLGAREEKFFSKAVTHVVTTRDIPPGQNNTSPDDDGKYESAQQKPTVATLEYRKATTLLDATLQRRGQSNDVDSRKVQGGTDILSRARELGIKIWALEKLHRILRTMLEYEISDFDAAHDTRSHTSTSRTLAKLAKNADLEQLLRNEKVNGPADRDMTVAAQDMAIFRGFYIYVHDMDEKTKPVMVRDYPKPATKEQGKWPQFRLSAEGRCPFVEDLAHTKKLHQREREAQTPKAQDDLANGQRRTRATSAQDPAAPHALAERQANLRRSPRKQASFDLAKPLDPPKAVPTQRQNSAENMPHMFGSAQQRLRGLPRMVGGEPVASGVQMSNITSAIRSQAVSSAAISSTAPNATRRVDSKEVGALKRKVLDRGASITSNHSMPSSYMNDMRAAINNEEPPPRAAKRKAQETLGVLLEDAENTEDKHRPKHRKPAPRSRKPVSKEPKPGYCENCRDKFDDFEEHCGSRKHRKFAMENKNWKELDALLGQLKRVHKSDDA